MLLRGTVDWSRTQAGARGPPAVSWRGGTRGQDFAGLSEPARERRGQEALAARPPPAERGVGRAVQRPPPAQRVPAAERACRHGHADRRRGLIRRPHRRRTGGARGVPGLVPYTAALETGCGWRELTP